LWSVAVTGVLGADQFLEHIEVRTFEASSEQAPEGAAEAATAQAACREGFGTLLLAIRAGRRVAWIRRGKKRRGKERGKRGKVT
jgi:hypothetical protein